VDKEKAELFLSVINAEAVDTKKPIDDLQYIEDMGL